MAQLNSSVVQGSLRVTDTTYTTDLVVSGSKTARYALIAPTSAGAPTWRALTNADVGLGNVENTKLSTWTGSTNITTLGTIGTGTWNATTIAVNKGGTGKTSWTQWGVLYASAGTTLANTTAGTAGYLLQGNGAAAPSWIQATNNNTASTIVKRDSSGNFSAGTITATVTNATTTEDTTNSLYIVGVTSAASTTLKRDTYAILKKAELTLGAVNNAGSIKLFSSGANSKAHIIQGESTTSNDFTHTLPNSNGWVATGASTGAGDGSTPIYLGNNGILSAVSSVSYSLLPTNDSFILTEGDNSANPPATAKATIPSNYALNRKIFYSQDTPSVTDADLGMFWFQPASFTMEDLKCLIVGVVATNTTSVTINNDDITTDMVVVKCVLSNPSAQTGDLTWTTTGKDPEDPNSRGNIVVNGTINGTTSMTFYLIHAR